MKKHQKIDEVSVSEKSGLNVFGNIKSGGAIFHVKGIDDGIEMHKAILYQIAEFEKIPRSWELDILIHNMARELHKKHLADIKSKGVSKKILELLKAPNKKTAQRLARAMILTHEEFANLTFNCGDYGYKKESKFFEYIPDHLKTTEVEKNAFFASTTGKIQNESALKFLRKMSNTLKERKNINI